MQNGHKTYETFINGLILSKCLTTKLWFNSDHIFKQFSSIGDAISKLLIKANITTFEKLLDLNPRVIEQITNKNPPFGIRLIETVRNLPKFAIVFEKAQNNNKGMSDFCTVDVRCQLTNFDHIAQNSDSNIFMPVFNFVLGDGNNNLLFTTRIHNKELLRLNGVWTKRVHLNEKDNSNIIFASLISKQFVGLDVHEQFPIFTAEKAFRKQIQSRTDRQDYHEIYEIESSEEASFIESESVKKKGEIKVDSNDDNEDDLFKLDLSPIQKSEGSKYGSSANGNTSCKSATNGGSYKNFERKFNLNDRLVKGKSDLKQSKIHSFFVPKKFQYEKKSIGNNEQETVSQKRSLDTSPVSSAYFSGKSSNDSSNENSSSLASLPIQMKKTSNVQTSLNFTSYPESTKFKGSSITINKLK